jgi:hypothetical protein
MSDGEAPGEAAAALVDELTDARRRGLHRLDLDTRQYKPVQVPNLERLARTYADDQTSARIALIRELLDEALADWDHQRHHDEAQFVRDLFFGRESEPQANLQPKVLLDRVKTERGLDDDAFDEQRRAVFRLFARFLIGFVAAQQPAAAVEDPKEQETQRRGGWVPWALAGGLAIALIAVLVTWLVTRPAEEDGGTPASGSSTSSLEPGQGSAVFTFDALGGRSQYINVYPGVEDTPEDRVANGTFQHDQATTALCQTTGRLVRSDTSVGEEPRESDVWLQVLAQPGKTSYAPLTYGRIEQEALEALPQC